MHIPKKLNIDDLSKMHSFINEFSFGIIISSSLNGTHLPFILHKNEGDKGTLYAHCAKANSHWQELAGADALIIFSGPHSYISPSWYAQTPNVPTWNYAAVHAYGKVSLLNNHETLAAVEELVHKYEPELLASRDIVTDEYRDKLLSAIVGFKIELTNIEGQLKLGQQRKKADQVGVYNALASSKNLDDLALVNYMKKLNVGIGSE